MTQTIKLKHTNTPDNPPASLAEGELALGLDDVPIHVWAGTPGGVELVYPAPSNGGSRRSLEPMVIEDAPSDGVYARSNGDWTPVPAVGATAPSAPVPNMLWCDVTTMRLYVYFDGQWRKISD